MTDERPPLIDVLLDTNLYDRLRDDVDTREAIASLIASRQIRVIAIPTIVDELCASPFNGLPSWFPIDVLSDSVAVLGHWHVGGASLGVGDTFIAHLGRSKTHVADAIVADSADVYAAIAVSEDVRYRRRLAKFSGHCVIMDYRAFQGLVRLQPRW